MLFTYVLFEAIDAMRQERAKRIHTSLNHHWQQFVHHLRTNKPKLNACLENLSNGLLTEQACVQ